MNAVIRFTREGFHCWPDAPAHRSYLACRHRHLFYLEVTLEVHHDEREVEYHDLLDFCKAHFPGGELHAQSCEMMARHLAEKVADHYPNRHVEVSCFEDNEVGARYIVPTPHVELY